MVVRSLDGHGPRADLRGRNDECALLDGLVADVCRGGSRSLVLRGEAGIGKTALLEHVVASAQELTVVRATGVEADMELAYAGIHQLCAPLLNRLEQLPTPQRQALEIVFGLSTGAAPDRFRVGLGVLSLLSEVAGERPLLCVIDDAQWLDHASALTLAFVSRRLLAEPVGLLFAVRETSEELRDISELEVLGLRNGDAKALLGSAVLATVDVRVRDRIIAETGGNPLALIELPRGLTAMELAEGFGLLGGRSLSGRIEESFVRRLEPLADDARRLLVLAAAEPIGDPLLLWRAADKLGIGRAAAHVVDAEGLLTIGERVAFRHPLVRSAVYRAAATEERWAIHLALAEATDREVDPDRRAWHMAAAAAGPDEEVAVELERSAGRAQARGGLAAAAAFLRRAVALTWDTARRADRALAAADASFQAGAYDAAVDLLKMAETGPLDELQRARVNLVRGDLAFASGRVADAAELLFLAGRGLEPFDLRLAGETYLKSWAMSAHFPGSSMQPEISRAILALPRPPGEPSPLDLLRDGLACLSIEGPAAALSTLERATERLGDISVQDVLRWGWVTTAAAEPLWDFESKVALSDRQLQIVRDAGALATLPIYLHTACMACLYMGDFAGAASFVAEAESVGAATKTEYVAYAALRLRALQGQADAPAAVAREIEQQVASEGEGKAASWAHLAAAELYNGLARYGEAASAARQATACTYDPWNSVWALPELVEAAVRAGDAELARDAFARLSGMTQPAGTDYALGIQARCQALLADGPASDAFYREAIERLSRTRLRPELARAHLLYGEWLRRENRRVDAREQLHTAYEMFDAIGMEAFAERARSELQASGEKVRKRTVETRDDLTGQERQIAGLARDGLSNPEIGERLFLSPRTVEWHLRNVFNKLDIHSRRELAKVLPGSAVEPAAE